MKKFVVMFYPLVMCLFFAFSNNLSAQTENSKDYAEFIFYRPAQGMMSGGAGAEIKLYMNDKEIEALANGVILKYKVYSEGNIKVKGQGYISGGAAGSPWTNNMTVKHGEVYHIKLEVKFPTGVIAETLEGKKIAEIEEQQWSDTIEKSENKDDPIIK